MNSHHTVIFAVTLFMLLACYSDRKCSFQTACLLTAVARVVKLNASVHIGQLPIRVLPFLWRRSSVGGCYTGVNVHQEATYVCIGDHHLWNNCVWPSLSPARLPCDKAEMEVCCRSEWGCNYFLTSLGAGKPSHSTAANALPLWHSNAL